MGAYQAALQADPRYQAIHKRIGNDQVRLRRYAEARASYERYLAAYPQDLATRAYADKLPLPAQSAVQDARLRFILKGGYQLYAMGDWNSKVNSIGSTRVGGLLTDGPSASLLSEYAFTPAFAAGLEAEWLLAWTRLKYNRNTLNATDVTVITYDLPALVIAPAVSYRWKPWGPSWSLRAEGAVGWLSLFGASVDGTNDYRTLSFPSSGSETKWKYEMSGGALAIKLGGAVDLALGPHAGIGGALWLRSANIASPTLSGKGFSGPAGTALDYSGLGADLRLKLAF